MKLSSITIAAIRSLLSQCSRNQIKKLLLEAGAISERIMPIPVVNNTKSQNNYHSINSLISLMFDTIYNDLEKDESDHFRINLLRIMKIKGYDI